MQAPERELLTLEKRYWEAMRKRNSSAATRLSDDTCVVVGAQGISELGKQSLAGMIEDSPSELREFSFDDADIHVRSLTDDVAVVAYKVCEKLVVDGKPTTIEAFDSSVWVRRGGQWVCAVHTESLAGDPYGRH